MKEKEIVLTSVGLNTSWSFYNKFLKYRITTVDQVLDDNLMEEILDNTKKKKVRDETLAFIDMINYQFRNQSLVTDVFLEEDAECLEHVNEEDCPVNFSRMGFTENGSHEFQKLRFLYIRFLKEHNKDQKYRLLDVFKYGIKDSKLSTDFEKKLKMYVDSYEKTNSQNISLEGMKQELTVLYEKRDKIDKKIKQLEENMKKLSEGVSVK